MAVLIETTLGDIVVDLFVAERPRCSLNFLKLCKMKYYNFCQFHSIEQNYVAQTGDPNGDGGESIFALVYGSNGRYFEPELVPKLRHTRTGLVSFVNNGSDMLGSQFFITLADNLDYLDDKHTIFGQVTEGLETLEKLNQQICDEQNRPYRDIRIAHTIILDDPFDDFKDLEYPSRSPSPSTDRLINISQIALDESLDEFEGKTEEEIRKEIEKKDMAAQAQILEMVGDLRRADDRPPDNVLFVCKLNPVTTDEDLQIIFSRFGAITCCEVIRDRRTQASLQYAFIEFQDAKSCEDAYFKMDNVLIDDRRIHVDFSQSVAKNYIWQRNSESESGKRNENRKRQQRSSHSEMSERNREECKRKREKSSESSRRKPSRDDGRPGHGASRSTDSKREEKDRRGERRHRERNHTVTHRDRS